MKKILKCFIIIALFVGIGFNNSCYAKRNPACTGSSKAVVLQVFNEGALAYHCPRVIWNSYSSYQTACKLEGTLVYLTENRNYVDDQIIKLNRNECFAENGVYRYENKKGDIKTVRAIDIILSRY